MPRSSDDWNAHRKKHQEIRAANRKKSHEIAQQLMSELRNAVNNCGLKDSQVGDFSGIDPATVARVMRSYHRSARFTTVVGILKAAGYRFKIIPIEPHEDEFRYERRFAPPPLEKN